MEIELCRLNRRVIQIVISSLHLSFICFPDNNSFFPMAVSESSLLRMAESLLEKLASSAIQQASLDIGVSNNLLDFKDSLFSLKDSLLEVDYERQRDPGLQLWLRNLKQVFHDAETTVDEIQCESLGRKQWFKAHGNSAITKVARFFSSSSNLLVLRLPIQINRITKRLQHCADEKIDIDERLRYEREITFPFVIDKDVIGREIDKEIIIEKLLMQHHHDDHDQSLSVLPIVGVGGLGKSTLAKIVLNDKRICESFSVKMWVCLSPHFNIDKVIIEMIDSALLSDTPYPRFAEGDLKMALELLESKLARKMFLLVLDDMCNDGTLKWDELRNVIPPSANGSKILLTTRSHSIASMTGTIPSHNLECLSLEDSLSLFENCATKREAEEYPDLIEVGREIVNRCGGVPLAIKTMGSMLFSKYEGTVEWESTIDTNGILPSLRLSYHYMPFHLKQCFELFSLYPNDYVFHSSEVVSLWTALDHLPSPNIDETLIDVSYQSLQEIIPRYFLKEFVNFGTLYYFQIHDLVHDLARDMAKYECVMVNSNTQVLPENVRHLSFVVNNFSDKFFTPIYTDVRTILFPIEGVGATSKDFLNRCVSRCRYLRILDLSDSTYEILPWSIGKLRHLRFLSLERNEKIKRVPNSICKLQNLQVLNLAGCIELKKLPKGLRNLVGLRQLGITTKESTLPENDIANMDSLKILNIESCDKLESFFARIKLPSLKTLEVTNCGSLKYLPLDIDHFPQLETLLVDNCGYLELARRHDDQNSNLQLKAIRLQSLPQLASLPRWLQKSMNTLKSLLIVDCKNFEMLPEWLSTFSVLGSFGMVNCSKLISLPNDIHHLTALGYLRIEGCPELCRKCQPQVGEYWPKISHIKQIFIGEPEDLNEEEEELEED